MNPTESQLDLLQQACDARDRAYARYSSFKVGAAIRSTDGRVFSGCNVENASYGLSMCAERVALFNAVSAGVTRVIQIAVCADAPVPATPCGACRQVLWEFGQSVEVIMGNLKGAVVICELKDLFPKPFELQR